MMTASKIADAFDAIAPSYDEVFTESPVGRAQRNAVWEVLDRLFSPGESILEVNCGTGADAVRLAARGVRVLACDVSPGMIEVARRRARAVRARHLQFEVRPIEELGALRGSFDGLLSNFGGLNCVPDLGSFAAGADRLLRCGAAVVLGYMGPFCAWETLWFAAQARLQKAARRWRRRDVPAAVGSSTELRIHYPTVGEIARALGPRFRLVEQKGVGVFVPPSYADPLARRLPRLLHAAEFLDRRVAGWPVFRSIADHTLLVFRKIA